MDSYGTCSTYNHSTCMNVLQQKSTPEGRSLLNVAMLHVRHLLAVIPAFAARTLWISRATGVDIGTVSFASCTGGLNWVGAAERVHGTVVPVASCVFFGSTSGHYAGGENVLIFWPQWWKREHCF